MAREYMHSLPVALASGGADVVAHVAEGLRMVCSCIDASTAKAKTTAGKKRAGAPSAYNVYMKVQLAKIKEEQEKSGKKSDHKENFKKVAAEWKNAPENPKNKK
ncbi:hypothetical protein B9479_000773 [Cryptococcus floricola]|uniref:Coiled-coil domain-containing protein n=1 Tax=Cryptococcus floricola TaxID=2591691 RepID=A0A5D3B8Q2_9TREE|nr:hypothetical protein B9479_000773 [Cryptococcus floricola]